jgi:hypothetical protein
MTAARFTNEASSCGATLHNDALCSLAAHLLHLRFATKGVPRVVSQKTTTGCRDRKADTVFVGIVPLLLLSSSRQHAR